MRLSFLSESNEYVPIESVTFREYGNDGAQYALKTPLNYDPSMLQISLIPLAIDSTTGLGEYTPTYPWWEDDVFVLTTSDDP